MLSWLNVATNRFLWIAVGVILFLVILYRRDKNLEKTAVLIEKMKEIEDDYKIYKQAIKAKDSVNNLPDDDVDELLQRKGYIRPE